MEHWQKRWEDLGRQARQRWQAGQSIGEIARRLGLAESTVALILPEQEIELIDRLIDDLASVYPDVERQQWVRRTMRRWATREAVGR